MHVRNVFELIFLIGAGLGWGVMLLLIVAVIDDWRSNRRPKEYRKVDAIFSDAHRQMERVRREQAR